MKLYFLERDILLSLPSFHHTFHFLIMQTLSQIQITFEDYLKTHRFENDPQALYEPINYVLEMKAKRLRPLLVLLGYYLFGNDIKQALPAALAVEIFHNFTLLHDDIMDEAPVRRGAPTVHIKYDTNTAILSGDVMLIYAYDFLARVEDDDKKMEIIAIFNKVAREVCEGQQRDMNFEKREDVSIDEYLEMIRQKTAVLLAGSLKIGAVLAGASSTESNRLYQFGLNVGLAFQLQDDFLDTFGDPKKFGKKVGGDIAQNKKTYLILKALEIANPEAKQQLQNLYFSNELDEKDKIVAVMEAFKQLKIKAFTEEIKEAYFKKAEEDMMSINAEMNRKELLLNLARKLMGREQ